MERLGIYIFLFFFLGLTLFERARTKGETGSMWRVLLRNIAVLVFASTGYFFLGTDIAHPGYDGKLFSTALSIIHYVQPYGEVDPQHRFEIFMDVWRQCLYCAAATLIVATGIWELRFRVWNKWFLVAVFSLLIYPLFGFAQSDAGFLGKAGFYDQAGALLVWALPAAFVLGSRLLISEKVLPGEKTHDLKGYKILPGMKHRFFLSRGIGFTMVFLVLNETTLIDHSWVISKTLILLPASLTIPFCNMLFFGLFGRNNMDRNSYAPPLFAVMGALVATQACNQYDSQQAIIASVVTTIVVMFYLRIAPLKIRFWDPICSVPIFLLGGVMGILIASMTDSAELKSQIPGVILCLVSGMGSGATLSLILRMIPKNNEAVEIVKLIEVEIPEETEKPTNKRKWFRRK